MWLNSQLTSSDQMMRGMHYPHDTNGQTPIRRQLFLKKLHVSSEQGIETFHPQTHAFGNCYNTLLLGKTNLWLNACHNYSKYVAFLQDHIHQGFYPLYFLFLRVKHQVGVTLTLFGLWICPHPRRLCMSVVDLAVETAHLYR